MASNSHHPRRKNKQKKKRLRWQILSSVIHFYVYLEKLKFVAQVTSTQIEVHGISILIFIEDERPARICNVMCKYIHIQFGHLAGQYLSVCLAAILGKQTFLATPSAHREWIWSRCCELGGWVMACGLCGTATFYGSTHLDTFFCGGNFQMHRGHSP